MSKKKGSKKKKRVIWGSILGLLTVLLIGSNIALYYFSDVISAYFSTIDLESEEAQVARDASTLLVEEIADEGIILLQNDDNVLPMETSEDHKAKINVFGWSFTDPIYGGTGSGATDSSEATTPKEGFELAGFEINEQLYNDYVETDLERPLIDMDGQDWSIPEPKANEFYTNERIEQAKEYSNTAAIFITRSGGEGGDLEMVMDGPDTFNPDAGVWGAEGQRYGNPDDLDPNKHYLELTNREQGMIDAVTENFDDIVLIVNSANTFELDFVRDYPQIKSVVNVAGPGETGFASLGKVLSGEVNPSGRTVDIFATDLTDAPAMTNFGDFNYVIENEDGTYSHAMDAKDRPLKYVDYAEGIYIGYRYYETAAAEDAINYDEKVIYPFGHGLSYTEFEQKVVDGSLDWTDTDVSVDVEVTNTGSEAGKEVVQLYYTPPYTGEIEKSAVDLIAFGKTDTLEPGASETVTLTFKVEDMAAYDHDRVYSSDGGYVLEQGEYELLLMKNSHDVITKVGSQNLSEIVYENGRSTDEQTPVNQFDDLVTGEGSITTYLSRENGFENISEIDNSETFTITRSEGETREVRGRLVDSDFIDLINSIRYDIPEDTHDDAPITGADNGKVLEDYVGVDIDDESWEELLDQLTVDELVDLTTLGGYRTIEIESIGKPATADYDGPAAINNMNMAEKGQSGIAFPTGVMVASTWNLELAEAMGQHIAEEAFAYGVTGWYAPGMNIHRTAFSGRNFEYYSEDPYLTGKVASAITSGYQSGGGYVYIKHFALNDQETNRGVGVLTWSNEQALRDIYLKPFEISVKEGKAGAVMSAFNSVGNTWAGASPELLKEVLRNEWGFKGMVKTDFFLNGNGMDVYPFMTYDLGIRAGNDIYLTGSAPLGVPDGIDKKSHDTQWSMREAAHNILYTVANSNAMDNDMSTKTPQWVINTIIIDVIVVLGIGSGFYFVFRRRKEAEEPVA